MAEEASPARSEASDVTTAVDADELAQSPQLSTGVSHGASMSTRWASLMSLERMVKTILWLPLRLVNLITFVAYLVYQVICSWLFTPSIPSKRAKSHVVATAGADDERPFLGRIAIVGAGLTGVSSAAHCIAHGYEVVIFESKDDVGGIWLDVNKTSGLQLHSVLYRFFPSIIWRDTFPKQQEIVNNVKKIWKDYDLESCTRFNTKVSQVHRHHQFSTKPSEKGHGRWVINNGEDGIFDAVIVAVGTTGAPKWVDLPEQDSYRGQRVHSSQLDGVDMDGKNVVILGSGASGVEAAELAVARKARNVKVLAHSDKWIIPRNTVVDVALALNTFGRQTPFSFIWEFLLRRLHYRSLAHLSPVDKGIFEATPIVNTRFLYDIREGKTEYLRGDAIKFTEDGILFHRRNRGEKPAKNPEDHEKDATHLQADVFVLATGYQRPSIDFLPQDLFPVDGYAGDYHRPNLYLQNFSTEDWSILLTNSSYRDAIGTVGNWHIGIYARILLAFLMDPKTRPLPQDMKLWVDCIRFLKRNAPGGSLTFFSYSELIIWTVAWHVFRFSRIRWLPFVLFGWKVQLEPKITSSREEEEEQKQQKKQA